MHVRRRQGKSIVDAGNGRCKGLEGDTSLACWRNTERFHWGWSEWQRRGGLAGRLWRQDPSLASFLPPQTQCAAPYWVPGSSSESVSGAGLARLWFLPVEGFLASSGLPRRNPAPHTPAQAPSTEISERFLWVSALGCETSTFHSKPLRHACLVVLLTPNGLLVRARHFVNEGFLSWLWF